MNAAHVFSLHKEPSCHITMTLNLLTAIINIFAGFFSIARWENMAEAAYLKSLQAMQSVCSTLPEGKLFVRMNGGELNYCLKWDAGKGQTLHTVTTDNGSEFAAHQEITRRLSLKGNDSVPTPCFDSS